MVNDAPHRSRLTPKGERTPRPDRQCRHPADLPARRGRHHLEDVRTAAQVSGSQLSHYFADKEDLVQAVIDRQASVIAGNQERADLGTIDGLRAWRNMVIAEAKSTGGKGGCPLGSLGSQLAESDPQARTLVAAGFGRWSTAISDGLRTLQIAGHLPAGINPDDLAVTLLAALQGGLLLAQVQRDTRPLQTALDTLLALASAT